MMNVSKRIARVLQSLFAVWLTGCNGEEITHYQVERTDKPAAATQKDAQRLFGVILPHGERTWFVKLVGPSAGIDAAKESLARFLASLEFVGTQDLHWTVPEGWRAEPASGMRYATFRIGPKDDAMELTITSLGAEAAEILPNVNRWRGQLSLPPITEQELKETTNEAQIAGVTATVVEFTTAGLVGSKPAAAAASKPSIPPGAAPSAGGSSSRPKLRYTTPQGWKELPATGGMRVAAFEVRDGGQSAEVTVIPLGGAAGGPLQNVNRWREQIGLGPVTEEQLRRDLRETSVAGRAAHFVELVGPESAGANRKSILAVMLEGDGQTWFFKMTGPSKLVGEQIGAFEAFTRSVQFE